MKFPKEKLQELVMGRPSKTPWAVTVEDKIVDHLRWNVVHELIFKLVLSQPFDDRYYRVQYYIGATENQDERPFENESDMVECTEVFSTERTITTYEE